MLKVDALQVFINASAALGIGLVWFNLNEKVFKTVRRLAAAPFSWPKKEAASSSGCSDEEEGDQSDACRGEMVVLEELNKIILRIKNVFEEHLKRRQEGLSDEEEGDQSDACRGEMVVLEELNKIILRIKNVFEEHLKRRQEGLSDEEEGDQSDACIGAMVFLEELNKIILRIKNDFEEHLKRRQEGLGKGEKIKN